MFVRLCTIVRWDGSTLEILATRENSSCKFSPINAFSSVGVVPLGVPVEESVIIACFELH